MYVNKLVHIFMSIRASTCDHTSISHADRSLSNTCFCLRPSFTALRRSVTSSALLTIADKVFVFVCDFDILSTTHGTGRHKTCEQ